VPDLSDVDRNWEAFGEIDPMWAVLSAEVKHDRRWDPDEFFASGRRGFEEFVTQPLREMGVVMPMGEGLDFGCGVGRLTRPMREVCERVVGVDVAESMVAEADRLNDDPAISFVVNKRSDLSGFESDRFDLVSCFIVLQHVGAELARGYIVEFVRILRPGGCAVFQMPTAQREPVPLPERACKAEFEVVSVLDRLPSGGEVVLAVTMRNTSKVEWPLASSANLAVGCQWSGGPAGAVLPAEGRGYLRRRVPPGGAVEVELSCCVPDAPGSYGLTIAGVQEGVRWFGQAIEVAVDVVAFQGTDPVVAEASADDQVNPDDGPVMEMHCIAGSDMVELLESSGMEVMRVVDDTWAGPDWESSTYYACKR